MACISVALKFFETLKKQMKKMETLNDFGIKEVGHLIPVTVGHRDAPHEWEMNHIKVIMKESNFKYNKEDFS